MLRRLVAVLFFCTLSTAVVGPATAAEPDIVLRSGDFKNVHGNWSLADEATAADGKLISSADQGQSTTSAPLAAPTDYFEATFDAPAGTSYHLWVRLRASGNSKYNDSVWLQYSDAVTTAGSPVYRIGTTDGLDVNLERCSGCGVSGWGWQDGAYWLSQSTTVQFTTSGPHTLRVQIREDGVEVDQIVLSNGAYLFESPGQMTGDAVTVPLSDTRALSLSATTTTVTSAATTTATTMVTNAATPYLGSAVSLPGHIKGEDFDGGGEGVSYHDTTTGNTGGQYRSTNVDIETCAAGGYDVGWIAAGEWLNYTVNVTAAGSYTVQVRVASPGGASFHVGFNTASNVWKSVNVPATGGWQSWTTVSVPVTLGAGTQQLTLLFDTGGMNLDYVDVLAGSTSGGTTTGTSGGTSVSVVQWNIQVNDSGAGHAQGAVDRVMAMTPRPKIVVLEEAHQSQYNTYINQLQAKSGLTWRGVFRTHCPPGAWNGSSCTGSEDEGVAVFTSLPVVDSGTTFLPYADSYHSARGVARMAVSVGGVVLQVFAVHLPPTNPTQRAQAISTFKSYASRYSAPQIAGGDFNADRNEIDPRMSPNFIDSWGQVASGNGFTAFTGSPSMKLDYWFQDAGGRAKPEWSVVVTATGTFSDHFPVINSYSVK
jgi:endonuclease/exonuclease/phosphatase family metal-dependent hydrolase